MFPNRNYFHTKSSTCWNSYQISISAKINQTSTSQLKIISNCSQYRSRVEKKSPKNKINPIQKLFKKNLNQKKKILSTRIRIRLHYHVKADRWLKNSPHHDTFQHVHKSLPIIRPFRTKIWAIVVVTLICIVIRAQVSGLRWLFMIRQNVQLVCAAACRAVYEEDFVVETFKFPIGRPYRSNFRLSWIKYAATCGYLLFIKYWIFNRRIYLAHVD